MVLLRQHNMTRHEPYTQDFRLWYTCSLNCKPLRYGYGKPLCNLFSQIASHGRNS